MAADAGPVPMGATSVRTVARDTPLGFLVRSMGAHMDGGTDLQRVYEATQHGISITMTQDPVGRAPRALMIDNVVMPEDGWKRGLMDQFVNDFLLKYATKHGFDIVAFSVDKSASDGFRAWGKEDWGRRVKEAQTRTPDTPLPEWQAMTTAAMDNLYILTRKGLKAGAISIWLHDKRK